MDLREKVFETLCWNLYVGQGELLLGLDEAADAILAIPEIAEALKLLEQAQYAAKRLFL